MTAKSSFYQNLLLSFHFFSFFFFFFFIAMEELPLALGRFPISTDLKPDDCLWRPFYIMNNQANLNMETDLH